MSVVSAGCLLWLQRLQPVLALVAVAALGYQAWLVWRRPAPLRTRRCCSSCGAASDPVRSSASAWVGLWLRYR